ncbi:hypothetical protein BJ875DRAFT_74334 [Amylocarpus encephaloides]|uniref:Carrier domain-containing protein n=1 Tax=Amylocarpus encephaloides TaxID=45428 RepID=A0A9P7YF19_9HELO|nr:hypothetical protein BJ875DRAFT_74334 [Amylocarpus encephaloides]
MARTCDNHTITGRRFTTSPPFWTTDAKFKHLRLAQEARNTPSSISFNALLRAATTPEAQDVVCRGLLSKLPSALMLQVEDMDITRPLSNYALDSLVAIGMRDFITRELETNLQVLKLLSSGCIETLAKAIGVMSKLLSFT